MMLDFVKKEYAVLIVGRDAVLNDFLQKELQVMYTVFIEGDKEKAIQNVQKHEPNLLIIDFDLPNALGADMVKYFMSQKSTSHIPLFALAKSELVEDKIKAINYGVEVYLKKPFSIKILKATIQQVLTKRKLLLEKYSLGLANINLNNIDTIKDLDRNFMQSVVTFIYEKLNAQDLNVETMASHFLLSRSQFYRKIKLQTGISPNEFIRKIRLEKAKKLLVNNDLNVNEVIYEVGFSSSSYFAKCFKKEFGYLPMDIKNK